MRTLLSVLMVGCEAEVPIYDSGLVASDTADSAAVSSGCTWQNSATFAGGEAAWDGCDSAVVTGEFAFADNLPPDTRALEILLSLGDDGCSISLRSPSVCGLGSYSVDAARFAATITAQSCPNLPSGSSAVYVADSGSVTLSSLSTGIEVGNRSGLPTPLYVEANYDIFAEGGVHFTGSVVVDQDVIADDFGTLACEDPG